ncbi:MAG: WD40/YVTN/BNR-like repeat-containing protein, partial [Flavobacteriaceae bacterium]
CAMKKLIAIFWGFQVFIGCSKSSDGEADVSEGKSNWTKTSYVDLSEAIASFPNYDGIGINDIAIQGNTIIMAVGQDAEERFGAIYRSEDKGKTWNFIRMLGCGVGNNLISVAFPSPSTVYLLGDCFDAKLLKSEDGGQSFVKLDVPFGNVSPLHAPQPQPMEFISESKGFILHLMTNDGGNTWEANEDLMQNGRILSFSFINTTTGFCNTATAILKTEDSGSSWTVVHEDPNEDFWNVYFVDDTIGFVSNNNTLLKTIDGGISWSPVLNAQILDISFASEEVGFAAGRNGIYKSTDQGTSWNINYSSNFIDFRESFSAVDTLRGFSSIEFDGLDFGIAGGHQNKPENFPNEKAYIAITTSLGE